MTRVHVFTSAAANYLPKVRALFTSIQGLHPEWQCHLLLVEDLDDEALTRANLPWPTVQVRDLAIPEWRAWSFCHTLVELATAVKPFMCEALLARDDCDIVLYFDPDILLFSRLDDVVSQLESDAIVLTPHQTQPEDRLEAVIGNEVTSLRYGTYNLGFIGIANRAAGRRFARWWAERLYRFCRDDPAKGLFTDQRWIDLVPSLFDGVGILRNTRLNVAAWNWSARKLSRDDQGRYFVNGEPLGFYHFTGIDSGNHALMLEKHPEQRVVIGMLLDHYRELMVTEGRLSRDAAWTFASLGSGEPVRPEWRRAYRDTPELQSAYPDPWGCTDPGVFEQTSTGNQDDEYLSPGYHPVKPVWDVALAFKYLRTAVLDPALGKKMLIHAGRVVSKEGVAGLRRRLSRSD